MWHRRLRIRKTRPMARCRRRFSVGPASTAVHPREYAARALAGAPEETAAKVLHANAARLYGLGG